MSTSHRIFSAPRRDSRIFLRLASSLATAAFVFSMGFTSTMTGGRGRSAVVLMVEAVSTPTETMEAEFPLSDSLTSGGSMPYIQINPVRGDLFTETTFSTFPVAFSCSVHCFSGMIPVDEYYWIVPHKEAMIVRMHRVTGVMSGWNTWPSGVTLGTMPFHGAYHTGTRTIWMVPYFASHVTSFNVDTQATAYCPTWPVGYTAGGGGSFWGSFIERNFLWMSKYSANMIVRVDLTDCSMTGHNNWPSGGYSTGLNLGGGYDGDSGGWFAPYTSNQILRVDVNTGVMAGYAAWPTGYNTGATNRLAGAVFDGMRSMWSAPMSANMFVGVDKDTGVMTGFNAWPSGFSLGSSGFESLTTDGTYLWGGPRTASHIVRVEIETGVITAFGTSGALNTRGITVDFVTNSLWVVDFGTPVIKRMTFTPTATIGHSKTVPSGLPISDGIGFSGAIPWSQTRPLEGELMTTVSYTSYPVGWSCSSICFRGVVGVEDYLWMIPYLGTKVIRVHRATGAMVDYNTWPGAVTLGTYPFAGAAYDMTHRRMWLMPYGATHVVYFDVDTGTASHCSAEHWPSGYSGGSWRFMGGIVEGERFVWMCPYTANQVIRLHVQDCAMVGHGTWPTGVTFGMFKFTGMGFDADHHIWLSPCHASHVVKINLWTGSMTAYNTWPGSYSGGTRHHSGATFDGQSVWFPPQGANMILKVDKDTGAMAGFNNWPSGWSAGAAAFNSAAFDGKYVWCYPQTASHLLRIEVGTGSMFGFGSAWQDGYGAWIDFQTNSLWVAPYGTPFAVTQIIFTSTATPELTASQESTRTQELGLLRQDGMGSSGYVPWADVTPLEGTEMHSTNSISITGGVSSGGIIQVGDYLWFSPMHNSDVLRYHKHTGAQTKFSAWPVGVTVGVSVNFWGASYDATRNKMWMHPHKASHVVIVDLATGTMSYCPDWPIGFTLPTNAFIGGFIERYKYLWLAPNSASAIVRYDLDDCSSIAHSNYCTSCGPTCQGGAVFDGDHHGWFTSSTTQRFKKVNLWTGAMAGFDQSTIPGFTPGTWGASTFDGQSAWAAPRTASHIVSIDTDTGVFTGHGTWPTGYTQNSGFTAAQYDGKYIWMVRFGATHTIRIEKSTGTMVGFLGGGTGYGAVIDFSMQTLFSVTSGGLFQTRFHTPTVEVTRTQELGLIMQDGRSSRVVPWSSVQPLQGSTVSTTTYSTAAAGCTNYCYSASTLVGDYLWLAPQEATSVVKVHKLTGTMTPYNSWPAGATVTTGKFLGITYDKQTNALWLMPHVTSHPIYVDATSGTMNYCPNWPSGYTNSGGHGIGGFNAGRHLWLAPFHGNMVVQVNMDTCAMTGHNSWPSGFSMIDAAFNGAAFDGDHTGWFTPFKAAEPVSVNLWTGTMTKYSPWPALWVGGAIYHHAGAAYDGQSVWLPPYDANMIVAIDKTTGTMSGYNSWPTGYTHPPSAAFQAGAYDGKYVWFVPNTAFYILRLDVVLGAIEGLAIPGMWSSSFTIDFDYGAMWLPPYLGTTLTKCTFASPTITESETVTVTPAPTATHEETPTATKEATATPDETATAEKTITRADSVTKTIVPPTPAPLTPAPPTPAPAGPPSPSPTPPPILTTSTSGTATSAASATSVPVTPNPAATAAVPTTPTAPAQVSMIVVTPSFTPVVSTNENGNGNSDNFRNSTTGRSFYGVRFEIVSFTASLTNVTAQFYMESLLGAAIKLSAMNLDAAESCNAQVPNQECLIGQLIINTPVRLDFVIAAPSYYKADLRVSYDVSAPAASTASTGHISLMGFGTTGTGGSGSSAGSNLQAAVTQSPPSAGNNAQSSPVFGLVSGAPCIDALLLSWILFLVVMAVLVVLTFYWARSTYKYEGTTTKKKNSSPPVQPTKEEKKLEEVRSQWRSHNTPTWRWLLLQNRWFSLFLPCHDQCAIGHGLSTFGHLLTLLWVTACLLAAATGGSAERVPSTTQVAVAILTVIIAQPLGPLLSVYYNHYTDSATAFGNNEELVSAWREMKKGGGRKSKGARSSSEGNPRQENGSSPSMVAIVAKSAVKTQTKTLVDVADLGDVELADDVEGHADNESLQSFEDDVVEKQQKSQAEEEEEDDEGVKKQKAATFQRLKEEAENLEETAGPKKDISGDDVREDEDQHQQQQQQQQQRFPEEGDLVTAVAYTATPFRNKGHLVNGMYVFLASILALVLGYSLSPDHNSTLCPTYVSDVVPLVLIIDVLAAQPLLMALSYAYRWMVSDAEGGVPMKLELHPRDCLVRDEENED